MDALNSLNRQTGGGKRNRIDLPSLSLHHLQGAFYVYLIGMILATVILGLENILSLIKRQSASKHPFKFDYH